MRMAKSECEDCGQLSPFHAYTCKRLPLREDIMKVLREKVTELQTEKEALVRERDRLQAEVEGLRADFEKQKKHKGALEIAMQEAHHDTDAANTRIGHYQVALREIMQGKGEFSRDQLEHASNTIANMKRIAGEALKAHGAEQP